MFSSFDGIKIYVYRHDHSPPHFHAIYAEYEALIDIRTLEVMAGELPGKQLKKVRRWAGNLQAALLEEFTRMQHA